MYVFLSAFLPVCLCVLSAVVWSVWLRAIREDAYLELGDAPTPEIMRVNLAQVGGESSCAVTPGGGGVLVLLLAVLAMGEGRVDVVIGADLVLGFGWMLFCCCSRCCRCRCCCCCQGCGLT